MGAGSKHKGRPMVWETREVREEGSHNRLAYLSNFHSIYILTRLDTRRPLTYPAPSCPCHHHLPCMQERSVRHHLPLQDQARGGDSWLFGAILTSFTSLACQSESKVVSWGFNTLHAPSTSLACQFELEADIHGVSPSFTPFPPPLHARASRR